ncbi:hypothetical protein KY285_017453 [Solanum tuberosum]|nr:hypothetical protein KY285_017453 [Solanum tuberosum]
MSDQQTGNYMISDFGMAKMFSGNQQEANTNRVVGTYGYMAPEYAMEGLFSTKSDVFSFAVLLLEIVSGRKNNSMFTNMVRVSLILAWIRADGPLLIAVLCSYYAGKRYSNSSTTCIFYWANYHEIS